MRSILGVVLVRDEDVHLARALRNAAEFCDEFLLFDHGSRDRTPQILEEFARGHPRAEVRRVRHPRESHEELARRAGGEVWVFGVDGDEVYDPGGLARLRPRLLAGEFDSWWMVMGHCFHADYFDETLGRAGGWMAPPGRSVTKLYNFGAIEAWPGRSQERLHGGEPVFRRGFDGEKKRLLFEETGWEDSPLRCLHLCFCRRSSLDRRAGPRLNIAETYGRRLPAAVMRLVGAVRPSAWKSQRYRRGPRVEVEATAFL